MPLTYKATAVWLDSGKRARTTPESIKTSLQETADGLLSRAVEKAAEIKEFRENSYGYYFSLTDHAPGPGEHKYLTQGTFQTGEMLTVFTVLTRLPNAGEVDQALRMFATATFTGR